MTFDEIFESMILDAHICETEICKCNIFAESSFREFYINCKEAELKVLRESGTKSDYDFLIEAAEESLFTRFKKSIKKVLDALKNFIEKIIKKIKDTVLSDDATRALNKLKKLVKENAVLKKETVQINDIDAEFKAIDKGIHELNAELVKIKSGKTTDRDSETINEIIEKTENNRKDIAKDTTAVTLKIEDAINLFEKLVKDANDGSVIKESKEVISEIEKIMDQCDGIDETAMRDIYKICSAKASLAKSKISSLASTIMTLWAKLKNKVFGINNKIKGKDSNNESDNNEKNVSESMSFFDSDEYIDQTVSEVFGETITENDDTSYSNFLLTSSLYSDSILDSDNYSSLFNKMESELFKEAYFGKTELLLQAEKILNDFLPIIRSNPLADYTNHPLNKALIDTLKKQFGFKELYITWKRSSKLQPSLYTLLSSDIIFNGGDFIDINKKNGYYDKRHAHTAFITLTSTLPSQISLTGAEYLAILLHEIGHNFDASLYMITNTIYSLIRSTIRIVPTTNPETGETFNKININILPMILSTSPGKSVYASITKIIESFLQHFPVLKQIANLGIRIGEWFGRVIQVYLSPIMLASIPLAVLLSPCYHLTGAFTRKSEMFADSFAASYGYGSELVTGLHKLEMAHLFNTSKSGSIKDALNDLNEHPVRKFLTDLALAENNIISLLINGTHGTDINRAKLNLNMLKNDLQTGNYPSTVRASLQQEVNKLESTINDLVNFVVDKDEETILPLTLSSRQIVYNAFNGRSDYIAKLFPDNVVTNESVDSSLNQQLSENIDDMFESIILDLKEK